MACLYLWHSIRQYHHISAASILSSSSVPHGITVHQGQSHSCCLCLMSRHLDDLTIFPNFCRSLSHTYYNPNPPNLQYCENSLFWSSSAFGTLHIMCNRVWPSCWYGQSIGVFSHVYLPEAAATLCPYKCSNLPTSH